MSAPDVINLATELAADFRVSDANSLAVTRKT